MNMRIVLAMAGLFGMLAQADQPGYQVCSAMQAEKDRLKCLEIVRFATRPFPLTVVKYCDQLTSDSDKNRVLHIATDRVFPSGALDVCEKDATAQSISALLTCIEKAGDTKPQQKVMTTDRFEIYVSDWSTHQQAIDRSVLIASTKCRGWANYALEAQNPNVQGCWTTSHAASDIDYYVSFDKNLMATVVPYTKRWTYKLYHCKVNAYCWRLDRDYTEVSK
jgi:hypothetical protein